MKLPFGFKTSPKSFLDFETLNVLPISQPKKKKPKTVPPYTSFLSQLRNQNGNLKINRGFPGGSDLNSSEHSRDLSDATEAVLVGNSRTINASFNKEQWQQKDGHFTGGHGRERGLRCLLNLSLNCCF